MISFGSARAVALMDLNCLRYSVICGLLAASSLAQDRPALDYATYLPLGGEGSVGVDGQGVIYHASSAEEEDCPPTPSGGTPCTPYFDATVTAVLPGAREPVYEVRLGRGHATGIAVRADGHAFVTGTLTPTGPESATGFAARIAPDGNVLYQTRFRAAPAAIAVDPRGNAFITGTADEDFDTTPGVLKLAPDKPRCASDRYGAEPIPCSNAFVLKLGPDGETLLATFFGGSLEDYGTDIALDAAGNIYITGDTVSDDYPVTINAAQPVFGGIVRLGPNKWGDGFAAKLDPTARAVRYSTYLGGSGPEEATAIAVDRTGSAVVVGRTQSEDLPTTPGVFQPSYRATVPNLRWFDRDDFPVFPHEFIPWDSHDGFAIKLTPAGAFQYVTYFGGPERDGLSDVALDADGKAYLAGTGHIARIIGSAPPSPCSSFRQISLLSPDGATVLGAVQAGGIHVTGDPSVYLSAPGALTVAIPSLGLSVYHDTFATTPDALRTWGPVYLAQYDFTRPAAVAADCVVNAASLDAGHRNSPDYAVAPYEIISLFGHAFEPETEILIHGFPAPKLYSGETQINAVAPGNLAPGRATLALRQYGQTVSTHEIRVVESVPGIFTLDGTGSGQAAVLNQDGSVNSPERPASPGSVVTFYLTGLGVTSPAAADGPLTPLEPPWPEPVMGFQLWIQARAEHGAAPMEILYAGAAPGLVTGAIQIDARIPEVAVTGDRVEARLVMANNERSQHTVTIAVR